jgi:hypothetical protein
VPLEVMATSNELKISDVQPTKEHLSDLKYELQMWCSMRRNNVKEITTMCFRTEYGLSAAMRKMPPPISMRCFEHFHATFLIDYVNREVDKLADMDLTADTTTLMKRAFRDMKAALGPYMQHVQMLEASNMLQEIFADTCPDAVGNATLLRGLATLCVGAFVETL